jgi:hypothetical protein
VCGFPGRWAPFPGQQEGAPASQEFETPYLGVTNLHVQGVTPSALHP